MKILQVNCVFRQGSTGKIMNDIHEELIEEGYDSIVCYGNGYTIKENNVYRFSNLFLEKINAIASRISGLMYGGCYFSTRRLINIIKKENPSIVHLHCLNGHVVNIYKLITWLKNNNIKTVLTLHAEFMYTSNCGHSLECDKWKNGCIGCIKYKNVTKSFFFDKTHESWARMYDSFKDFNDLVIVSVSPWLRNRAMKSPILQGRKNLVVLNGLDTEVFKRVNTDNLKKSLGLENKKIIFHATAHFSKDENHIKGGYYVLKLAEIHKNVQFIIAGEHDNDIKVPSNCTLLGKVEDQNQLAKYYSMADITILTSKRETFSMVTAESLCCGTPIVGFKAGAPEQIALKEYSAFVEYGDIEKMSENIKKILANSKDKNIAEMAKIKYSKLAMTKKYIEIYTSLYRKCEGVSNEEKF